MRKQFLTFTYQSKHEELLEIKFLDLYSHSSLVSLSSQILMLEKKLTAREHFQEKVSSE